MFIDSTSTYPQVSLRSVFLIFSKISCWLIPMYAIPIGIAHCCIALMQFRTWTAPDSQDITTRHVIRIR